MNFSDSSGVDSNWFSIYSFPHCHQHGYVSVVYMYNCYAQMTLLPPVYRAVLKGQRHTASSRYSQDLENFLFSWVLGSDQFTSSKSTSIQNWKYVHIWWKTFITSLEVLNFFPILPRDGYDSSKILSRFVPLHCDNLKYKKIEYITLYFENKCVRSFHIFLIVVLFPCRHCLIIHGNTV